LSQRIVAGWSVIAGLANLDRNEIENVNCENISYPQPKDKAARILSLINNRSDFSRRKIGNILEEAGISALVDDVLKGTLR
jgi:ribosomal protein S26